MEYDTSLADRAYSLASAWHSSRSLPAADLAAKFSASDLHGWSATQIVLFLETLGTQDRYGKETLEAFEGIYRFNANANPEIKVGRCLPAVSTAREWQSCIETFGGLTCCLDPGPQLRWFLFALKAGLYAPEAAHWVRDQGRMKYCRPTYRAIYEVDPDLARETFRQYGVGFLHPIARRLIAHELGLEGDKGGRK